MALTSGLDTALQQSEATVFIAVRIELANATINLVDGAGVVSFPVNGSTVTFSNEDPIAGSLQSVGQINESLSTEAPRVTVTLSPSDTGGIADLADVLVQKSPCYIWSGAVNPVTGAVVGFEMLFAGKLDTTKVTSSGATRFVELDVVSGIDRLFIAGEGNRLNQGWLTKAFPSETGLRFMSAVSTPALWMPDVKKK